jgi:hypothetical protein
MSSSQIMGYVRVCGRTIALTCLAALIAAAQDVGQVLYLIQANPGQFLGGHFPATLFAVAGTPGALREVRKVTEDTLSALHFNDHARLATVVIEHRRDTTIELIDFNHPSVASHVQFEYGDRSALESFLISHPTLGIVQTLLLSPLNKNDDALPGGSARPFDQVPGYLLLGSALRPAGLPETKVQRMGTAEYSRIRLAGDAQPGIGADENDSLFTLNDSTIGMRGPSEQYSFGVKIPAAFMAAGPDQLLAGHVCNEDVLAVSREIDRTVGSNGLGSSLIYIFDKHKREWTTLKLPGDASRVRGFGPYLAVMVAESTKRQGPSPLANRKSVTGIELQNEELARIQRFRPSPGVSPNYTEYRDTGVPASQRFASTEIYAPGKLIVYNTRDGKEATIETSHGDSEVLFVSNSAVVYRMDRSIYLAQYDGAAISPSRLLVEDDNVRDIHWAFWGPEER